MGLGFSAVFPGVEGLASMVVASPFPNLVKLCGSLLPYMWPGPQTLKAKRSRLKSNYFTRSKPEHIPPKPREPKPDFRWSVPACHGPTFASFWPFCSRWGVASRVGSCPSSSHIAGRFGMEGAYIVMTIMLLLVMI